MLGVCSVMGLPWFVAATVLSISHVNSLKLESECSAPGEQPKFLGIREQRFTGLMIFTLMGCSVFMTSVLKVRKKMYNLIFLLLFPGKKHLQTCFYFCNNNLSFFFFCIFISKYILGGSYIEIALALILKSCSSPVHPHACAVWSLFVHGSIFT